MDNQHQKISGYRDLTQHEIDMMNELKALEAECLAAVDKVDDHLTHLNSDDEINRKVASKAHRWAAIARTDIETGFMAAVRAVAQPQPKK